MKAKNLRTRRLILRPFKRRDAKKIFVNWASDDEVAKYMIWNTHRNIAQTKLFVKKVIKDYKFNPHHWIITLNENKEVIGSIGVTCIDSQTTKGEIGYCLSRKYWNKGIMSEALKAVIDYLFNENKFQEITAKHHIDNIASGRVMQKCGMSFVGKSHT
jgi:ribosomal-protein-alanine N-acetyltransferase